MRHTGEFDRDNKKLATELSILPNQPISAESLEFYERHNYESPLLSNNQLSMYGVELRRFDGKVEIKALVRSTVQKEIRLKKVPVLLIDSGGRPVAKRVFDLQELGSLPPNSARPWTFIFPQDSFFEKSGQSSSTGKAVNGKANHEGTIDLSSWSLAFERNDKSHDTHRLDLANTTGIKPSPLIKRKLEKLIEDSPPLGRDEVKFTGLSVREDDNGDLVAIILIRNGTPRNIILKQVPLEVMDANKDIVASGTFRLENLVIKANTSKPTRFVFPASGILKADMDLSKWKIYHANKKQKM